jgi:ATP-dependent RNA helicase DbpA
MSKDLFQHLNLSSECLKNIETLGFANMTAIQAKSLPDILAGRDLVGQAQTGSGKTVAFALKLLTQVEISRSEVQGLVLCPTRELASQVADEIRRLGRYLQNLKVLVLCGGTPIRPQMYSLERGAHIIVGTPGRLTDHLSRKSLSLSKIKTLVLDEADRMLDMGFSDEISYVVSQLPSKRQTLLFSATFPSSIEEMSRDLQVNPVHVKTENSNQNKNIEQKFFEVQKTRRKEGLLALLDRYEPASSIVFCATKLQCDELASFLQEFGIVALAIHGDLLQSEREEVLIRFSNGSVSVLVATDVAARGLDIKDLSAVINYQLSPDPEIHVHRIGRTGRAGHKGMALSLYAKSEMHRLEAIENFMQIDALSKDVLTENSEGQINLTPEMITLKIFGGKKNKLRPGDILGVLTKDAGIKSQFIGRINILDFNSYVGVHRDYVERAHSCLVRSKIKNRNIGSKIIW